MFLVPGPLIWGFGFFYDITQKGVDILSRIMFLNLEFDNFMEFFSWEIVKTFRQKKMHIVEDMSVHVRMHVYDVYVGIYNI